MIRFTKDSVVDTEKYEHYLNYRKYIYLDRTRVQLTVKYQESQMRTASELALRQMRAETANRLVSIGVKDNIFEYLIDYVGCPESRFKNRKTSGLSLDKKKVLLPLYNNGYAKEFIENYLNSASLKTITGKMKNIVAKLYDEPKKNNYGDEIYKLGFNVEQQTNLRYNYNNTDIITIPKLYNDCITVPEGYVIAWGDFAQSDLRIAYNLLIRDERNAKIMDACKDKYEGIARIIAEENGEKFDQANFKKERDLYKVYVLATIYGRRTGDSKEANDFIHKFAKYLETCPRYVEYFNRINNRYQLGLSMFITGYFGHKEAVAINPIRKDDTVNFALNSPIQTGTSEIMILTVNEMLKKFYEHGCTEEDICLYYTRHDEPVFIMKESLMSKTWLFEECSEIHVDNWTPLRLDFNYGYRYKEPNQRLQKIAKEVIEMNRHSLTQIPRDTSSEYNYMPLRKTLLLSMGYAKIADKAVIAFYDDENKCADFILADTNKEDELGATIRDKMENISEYLYDMEYSGALIGSSFMDGSDRFGKIYFKYEMNRGTRSQKAEILAYYMAKRYCDREGIELDIPDGIECNFNFARTVGALGMIK